MRAAVFVETGGPLVIEDLEPAPPGPRDVIVQLGASGVCHSDLSLKNGYVGIMPGTVLGHEGAGTIVEVGKEVSHLKKGDHIVASFIPACGVCWFCLRDQSHLCDTEFNVMMAMRGKRPDQTEYMTMTGLGTFAETMTCDQSSIVKVETQLPDEQLALIGCGVTTGVGAALNTAGVEPGSSVAIIGLGGVGQSVLQGCRIAGAGQIIAVDPVELKRKTAEQLGATDLVDTNAGDPVEQVKALTSGRGVDYAFEVIGLPETTLQAYNMIRKGGTAVMVGMTRAEAEVTIPTFDLFFNEKTLKGCKYGSGQVRRDFQRFADLIETGRLDTAAMVSRTVGLDDVNEAFRAMEAGEVIRSVITNFGGSGSGSKKAAKSAKS
jgi:S-(hydroxymethyl)glutathione dehydrogenase / alcohol dehydrogenase